MYRIASPNFFVLSILILAGVLLTAVIPSYVHITRILSFSSLVIGELGMSFIPSIALYPKANPLQLIVLSIIFFFTTLIISISAWSISALGWTGGASAFLFKDGELSINAGGLFVANITSLINLAISFKLTFDEEALKNKNINKKFMFRASKEGLLKRPTEEKPLHKSKIKHKKEEDFGKPFDFNEKQELLKFDNLPEESSGALFVSDEEERPVSKLEKPSRINLESALNPPTDIKSDLSAIFEQYSSLNAVKKITTGVSEKYKLNREKRIKKRKYEDGDVVEANFTTLTKSETDKNEIIESLKDELKEELIESLKSELKKELITGQDFKNNIDIEKFKNKLSFLCEGENILGTFLINPDRNLIFEKWKKKTVPFDEVKDALFNACAKLRNNIHSLNQGSLNHLLLESSAGVLILGIYEGNIVGISTNGTARDFSGQILKALSELEDMALSA